MAFQMENGGWRTSSLGQGNNTTKAETKERHQRITNGAKLLNYIIYLSSKTKQKNH